MFSWSESNGFIFSLDEKSLLCAISNFADYDVLSDQHLFLIYEEHSKELFPIKRTVIYRLTQRILSFIVLHLLRTTGGHSKPLINADVRWYACWLAGSQASRLSISSTEFYQDKTMTSAKMNVLQLTSAKMNVSQLFNSWVNTHFTRY